MYTSSSALSLQELLVSFSDRDAISRHIPTATTVLYQGEVPHRAGIVQSGLLRVYNISNTGDEQIVDFIAPGEYFPNSWLFHTAPAALFFYDTVSDTKIMYVEPNQLLDYLQNDRAHQQALIHYLATKSTAALIRISALEQTKARDKLIYTLFYLCHRHGTFHRGQIHIDINLTHQTLAALVGLTRETTATELVRLKKEGVISYSRQEYKIRLHKLLPLMGEESFEKISISLT